MSERPAGSENGRLESWKAIAAYLNRDVRTVMRWEKSEGLPVHRLRHLSRSSVYAYPQELDAWRANRRLEPAPSVRPSRLRPFAVAAILTLAILSGGGGMTSPLTAGQAGPVDRVLAWPDEPSKAADESMSPDAHDVAYIDMATHQMAIRDLRSGQAHTLTAVSSGEGFVDYPVISNDGRRIAYSAMGKNHAGGLFVLPVNATSASTPRRLFEGAATAKQWSRDDQQILFTINREDGSADIALVSVQTATTRVLKSLPFPGPGNFVSMSPDGKFVAYDLRAEHNHRQRDLWMLRADDGTARPLLTGPTSDSAIGWSPDGRFVIFLSDRIGSHGNGLWALPVSAGSTSGDPKLLKADFRGTPVSLTRSGALFFEQGDNTDDLLIAPLGITGVVAKPVPEQVSHDQRALSGRPRWSSNGEWLMYETFRPGGSVIAMRNLKTGAVTEVPLELAYWWTFDLSPDGRKIVCRATDLEQHKGVFIVDTSTGAVERVALWREGVVRQFVPQFSRDGQAVTWVTGDYHGHDAVVEHDLATGMERAVAEFPPNAGGVLRRSPDGRFALTAVETSSPPAMTLRVIDMSTKEIRDVFRVERTGALTSEDGAQWMPDSRAVVANIRGASENVRELWWIPIDGGEPHRLDVGVGNVVDSAIAIDPEGRRIAFVAGDPTPSKTAVLHYQFRLLEHFLPKD